MKHLRLKLVWIPWMFFFKSSICSLLNSLVSIVVALSCGSSMSMALFFALSWFLICWFAMDLPIFVFGVTIFIAMITPRSSFLRLLDSSNSKRRFFPDYWSSRLWHIITFLWLSSWWTSEKTLWILGKGFMANTLTLTSSRSLLSPNKNLYIHFFPTICLNKFSSLGHFHSICLNEI